MATLAILVLLLGLTIALFLSATSERRNASLYKNSQGLRELADTSVNLVQAQIKDATSSTATSAPQSRTTWASQPGMIRTYRDSATALTSYKLYTWSDPRPAGDAADIVPANWFQNKALFTDLNEPVPDSDQPTVTSAFRYPIAYPPATGSTAAEGYSIASTAPLATGGTFTNPVPMPVQWLYVLQDGVIAYPTASSGSTVTVPGATAANPIVSRIAYWTDDESTKLNLNTAAGGEFWGPPIQRRSGGQPFTLQMSNSIWLPTRWEFQRYPGHPARTDLLAVFRPEVFELDSTIPADVLEARRRIWQLTPRVSDNGVTRDIAVSENLAGRIPSNEVPYDMDRLFASIGEARFAANPPASGTREDFIPGTWKERIEASKFLLTSSSRAPETTLFGTPRVSIWPIPQNSVNRTALDALFAFCSTIRNSGALNNPKPYYFTRSTPSAFLADGNANADMFRYLEDITAASSIPGFPYSGLVNKYTVAGRDQLLTQFYDYIRNVNKNDAQLPVAQRFAPMTSFTITVPPMKRTVNGRDTYGFGRFPTINQVAIQFICTADANVPTSNVAENRSLWATTSNATFTALPAGQKNIQAIVYLEAAMPASGMPDARYYDIGFTVKGLDQLTINGQNLGFPASVTVTPRPNNAGNNTIADTSNINTGYAGGVLKYLAFLVVGNGNSSSVLRPVGKGGFAVGTGGYPLISDFLRINSAPTMTLNSTDLDIELNWPLASTDIVHQVTVPFQGGSIPTPDLPPPLEQRRWVFYPEGWDGLGVATTPATDTGTGRFSYTNFAASPVDDRMSNRLMRDQDTVIAMATAHADYRLSMVRPTASTHWARVPASAANPRFAHRLFNGSTDPLRHPNLESLAMGIPALNTIPWTRPPIPTQAQFTSAGFQHPLALGDFDNGLPTFPDGALINAPEEVAAWATGAFRGMIWANTSFGNYPSSFHTPNRRIASPVAFGSLPSAAVQDRPWQNMLFRPAPGVNHPGKAGFNIDGSANPLAAPDHLWLDLFWMPIVEPYAISETFSTAGKVNMNYRIAPFSYINRSTGMRAVLRNVMVNGVSSVIADYSGYYGKSESIRGETLFPVNVTETLLGFSNILDQNRLFRTASEICELPIVPQDTGATFASLTSGAWWQNYRMTGDNTRETVYNDIYPRLTTRSNTYTVHYRVQVLKKRPGGDPAVWDETKDNSVSELRGSTLIERFLDPNAVYPDYTANFNTAASLDNFYRFRVLQRSDFTP